MLVYSLMRRTQAILAIVALLATPLALVARGLLCDTSVCACMCCKSHSNSSAPRFTAAELRRITAGYCPYCGRKLQHRPADYGFIAPIAPTAPLPVVTVPSPAIARETPAIFTPSPLSGYLPEPFEPPRA